ncbi:MAG: glycosyltransferase family 39 protein, partial [Candidatus Woesebacteria bacterium]|nr:glycosyltransferase family 39 protein [Candidatus Woesebacteria bacterium]
MLTVFNQSLWGDEAFSAILSLKPLPNLITTISKDTSPPLWNVCEWAAFQLFGTSEVVIRSISFLFFLITVFFAFLIAKHFWDKKTAFIAGVLTFLNPFFFIYAFEGRMYSIMAAGVAGSMYFFIKRKWAPYIIATLWALYSHHFAIFAVIIQGFWFLYEYFFGERKKVRGMLIAFIAVAVGYTPWLIPLYNQTKMVGGGFWLGKPTTIDLRNLFYDYLGEGIKHKLAEGARITVLITLTLRAWEKDIKKSFFLLSWFLTPILLTWLISQKFTPVFYNRYLLYTIPGAMIILASQRRKVSNLLITLIIFLFIIIDRNYFFNPSKIPFKDLASYVKQTQIKGDLIINEDAGNHKLWESKYYG